MAFGSVLSTLYIPLFLAAVGIIFRGAAFATRGSVGTVRGTPVIGALFILSSILTPFFLAAAVGGIASGRVPVGNASGDAVTSWWNPTSILVGCLAVVTGAYLAAVYLAADARRASDEDLAEVFRRPGARRRRGGRGDRAGGHRGAARRRPAALRRARRRAAWSW